MKPVLLLAAALAMAAAPALTQEAPAPGPAPSEPSSNYASGPATLDQAFNNLPGFDTRRKQCFNGRLVAGANRSGGKTVYLQSQPGGIFRLELAGDCAALDAAEKLTVRADGADMVCAGSAATMIVKTAAGSKRCAVQRVARLSSTEAATLATAARR